VSLALIAEGSERRQHIEAARAVWTSVDRPDLVETLKELF
jgi:hypothetical protein